MRKPRVPLLCVLSFAWAACASPQSAAPLAEVTDGATAHTRRSDAPARIAPALALQRLNALLAGRWRGQGFGGEIEETWNPYLGDRMLGTFRLVQDGALVFSEHMQIAEGPDGSVALSLVHLDPSLTTWEERGETTGFKLVDASQTTAWFGGLTLHRHGDVLDVYLAMKTDDGMREELLTLERVGFGD